MLNQFKSSTIRRKCILKSYKFKRLTIDKVARRKGFSKDASSHKYVLHDIKEAKKVSKAVISLCITRQRKITRQERYTSL